MRKVTAKRISHQGLPPWDSFGFRVDPLTSSEQLATRYTLPERERERQKEHKEEVQSYLCEIIVVTGIEQWPQFRMTKLFLFQFHDFRQCMYCVLFASDPPPMVPPPTALRCAKRQVPSSREANSSPSNPMTATLQETEARPRNRSEGWDLVRPGPVWGLDLLEEVEVEPILRI